MSLNPSSYYEIDAIAAAVERGGHRQIVGDLWDELGALQIEFLVSNGLAPHHTLLDIGCGSLRLGVRAISHLNVGCYWGTDINESLMSAGYEREVLPAGLGEKLPRTNLVQDADFTFKGIPHHIDFAVAQSVFTHLPLNHMRLCLANLSAHLAGPCEFFFTVFMLPEGESFEHPFEQIEKIITYPHRDPYHYTASDILYAAANLPWQIEFVGDWGHPRNQKMVRATKTKGTNVPRKTSID